MFIICPKISSTNLPASEDQLRQSVEQSFIKIYPLSTETSRYAENDGTDTGRPGARTTGPRHALRVLLILAET